MTAALITVRYGTVQYSVTSHRAALTDLTVTLDSDDNSIFLVAAWRSASKLACRNNPATPLILERNRGENALTSLAVGSDCNPSHLGDPSATGAFRSSTRADEAGKIYNRAAVILPKQHGVTTNEGGAAHTVQSGLEGLWTRRP